MPTTVTALLRHVLDEYTLEPNGIHGVAHWARVLENGLRLAAMTGANVDVVKLFAVLHDSRRLNDNHDPDHGPRAAEFARRLRGRAAERPASHQGGAILAVATLADHEFALLCRACEGHTHERTHPDVTIQTCWDSDRLDLARVGIMPHPSRLCTSAARSQEIIAWANQRAISDHVPAFVREQWVVELASE